MEFQALHEKAQRCAEQYRRNEAELVGLLQQIDSTQAFKALAGTTRSPRWPRCISSAMTR